MDLLLSSREAKAFGRSIGSVPALLPICKPHFDDMGINVIYAKLEESKHHEPVPYWRFFAIGGAQVEYSRLFTSPNLLISHDMENRKRQKSSRSITYKTLCILIMRKMRSSGPSQWRLPSIGSLPSMVRFLLPPSHRAAITITFRHEPRHRANLFLS